MGSSSCPGSRALLRLLPPQAGFAALPVPLLTWRLTGQVCNALCAAYCSLGCFWLAVSRACWSEHMAHIGEWLFLMSLSPLVPHVFREMVSLIWQGNLNHQLVLRALVPPPSCSISPPPALPPAEGSPSASKSCTNADSKSTEKRLRCFRR